MVAPIKETIGSRIEDTLAKVLQLSSRSRNARTTLVGYLDGLSRAEKTILDSELKVADCATQEEFAVRLLRDRLKRLDAIKRSALDPNRNRLLDESDIRRIGLSNLYASVVAAAGAGYRVLLVERGVGKNGPTKMEARWEWPKARNAKGCAILDLRSPEDGDYPAYCDQDGDLTEESLRCYLLGLYRPPGKVSGK